jgi:hypothetical protein
MGTDSHDPFAVGDTHLESVHDPLLDGLQSDCTTHLRHDPR